MASTWKGQQKKGKKPLVTNPGEDHEEQTAVPLSVTQALQNDLVLESIFSCLSIPDLKACRLVCQQWKLAIHPYLVEKCPPVGFFAKFVHFQETFKIMHSIQGMAQLTRLISTSTGGNGSQFPVTKFTIDASMVRDASEGLYGLEDILRQFFKAIGPLVTELEIGFFYSLKLFQSIAPLNVEFPKLKTLTVKCTPGHFSPVGLDLEDILTNAPQLGTLDIGRVHSETLDLLLNLMERVDLGRKIRNLYLGASFRDNHFNRLTGIGLKLTSLRLNLVFNSGYKEVGQGWMNFLESQSDTLEELHVECDGWRREEEFTVRFPQLRKLKRLTLGGSCDDHLKFDGMGYTNKFPILEELSLGPDSDSCLETLLSWDMTPVETVKVLKLPHFLNDPVWVWHAARIFPNVKKLKIPGRMEVVKAVFQAWRNVEELTIKHVEWEESANQLLTANFTGVLPSNYRLKTKGQPDKFLKDLKILRLQGFHRSVAPTTRICHFVLLKMGSLTCLDLSKCEDPQLKISKCMLNKMRKKFLVLC